MRSPPRTTGPGYERVVLHYDVGGGYRPGHQANPPDDFDIRSIPEESIRPMTTQGRGTPQRSTTSNHQTVRPSEPHYQAGSERDEGPVIVQEPPIRVVRRERYDEESVRSLRPRISEDRRPKRDPPPHLHREWTSSQGTDRHPREEVPLPTRNDRTNAPRRRQSSASGRGYGRDEQRPHPIPTSRQRETSRVSFAMGVVAGSPLTTRTH